MGSFSIDLGKKTDFTHKVIINPLLEKLGCLDLWKLKGHFFRHCLQFIDLPKDESIFNRLKEQLNEQEIIMQRLDNETDLRMSRGDMIVEIIQMVI